MKLKALRLDKPRVKLALDRLLWYSKKLHKLLESKMEGQALHNNLLVHNQWKLHLIKCKKLPQKYLICLYNQKKR